MLAVGLSDNEHLQYYAAKAVLGKAVQHWKNPFEPQTRLGDIKLGETIQEQPYYLSVEDLSKHLLAVGQSGVEKMTLFYTLLSQLEPRSDVLT